MLKCCWVNYGSSRHIWHRLLFYDLSTWQPFYPTGCYNRSNPVYSSINRYIRAPGKQQMDTGPCSAHYVATAWNVVECDTMTLTCGQGAKMLRGLFFQTKCISPASLLTPFIKPCSLGSFFYPHFSLLFLPCCAQKRCNCLTDCSRSRNTNKRHKTTLASNQQTLIQHPLRHPLLQSVIGMAPSSASLVYVIGDPHLNQWVIATQC